jgi:hypothetical protein
MGSEHLVILSDPLTFGVMDMQKYFQEFKRFIESNMANNLFSFNESWKAESLQLIGYIGFNKFCKIMKIFIYVCDLKSWWVT